ncbi:hypothetical protein MUS1_14505 [Marinomonas ushuaiensis DSM 15871]|uniref:DUF3530 family protein n=1 Tax=Marinomonas ushuaiensis DSM 15871 TaxID=1122207 RepID=X7E331_9GAMM|nr:DUF3530 family protein [Marinomonas ushuaiensis]ETX10444.1 hypothetical protein MUS1_14505 [Marinomonas ushuaiensis DSM 15871]
MNKNTTLLNIIISFTLLSACNLSLAEDSAPANASIENTEAKDNTKVENNSEAENKVYVIPTPQISRISALETSLKNRQLTHQLDTLEANGDPFLTLYQPSLTSSTQGCVIILHSDNEHPDWPDAVAPLRNALPEHSWCTISIEVPDITKRAEAVNTQISTQEDNSQAVELPNQDTVFSRILATIAKAQSNEIEVFALLGYKTGAAYALNFLANNSDTANALILIDIETPATTSHYSLAQQVRKIPQPILDYYINSNAGSSQFAMWRKQAANQRTEINNDFIQLDAVPDRANGKKSKQLLVQRVRGFLKQNTNQRDQRKTLPSVKKGLFYESP